MQATLSPQSGPPPARWLCVGIFVTTLPACFPALDAGFIWDDYPGHATKPGWK